jgi:hypothetical protein
MEQPLSPQHWTVCGLVPGRAHVESAPSDEIAMALELRLDTVTGTFESGTGLPLLSSPWKVSPQHCTSPVVRRAHAWKLPVTTSCAVAEMHDEVARKTVLGLDFTNIDV